MNGPNLDWLLTCHISGAVVKLCIVSLERKMDDCAPIDDMSQFNCNWKCASKHPDSCTSSFGPIASEGV